MKNQNTSTWIKDGKIIDQADIDFAMTWYAERLSHLCQRTVAAKG